jgi:hypothetical protein
VDIDATFLPVAQQLIDQTFGTDVIYRRTLHGGYNPATGQVQSTVTDTPIKAGVLNRGRSESGGSDETWTLNLWVHHGPTGVPFLPTTADEVIYDGIIWKVTGVDPTYSSKGLIASKLACRAPG